MCSCVMERTRNANHSGSLEEDAPRDMHDGALSHRLASGGSVPHTRLSRDSGSTIVSGIFLGPTYTPTGSTNDESHLDAQRESFGARATRQIVLLSDTVRDRTPLLIPLNSLPLRVNVNTSDSQG